MTEKEALLFFPHNQEDDLNEIWEERQFEQKQFFLTRPPISKVFKSRLKKLEKQYMAYLTLKKEKNTVRSLEDIQVSYPFSEEIIPTFNTYHSCRNKFKHKLLKATDFASLQSVVESWLNMEKEYYTKWKHEPSLAEELDTVKSKEPDPMIILEKLKLLSTELNIKTFSDLKEHYNHVDEVIRNEVKRLTLLSKD